MRFGIRHIHHFAAVAEELHFHRAANRLNIAQPALSRSIKHLESQIDVQLLERNNRNVKLTDAGKVFLSGCHALIENIEDLVVQTQKASAGKAGHLVIGYTDFAISGLLPRILRDFRQLYPDVTVEPVHAVTKTQLNALESEKFDFGFLTGPFEQPGYTGITVQNDSFVAILFERHRLTAKKHISLSDLEGEPFILGTPADWQHYHDHLYRLCRSAGFEPDAVQNAFNTEGIFGLVACEMGISVQPGSALNYIRKGLVVRPIFDINTTLPTMAVWKNCKNSPTRRIFAQFLLSQNWTSASA